MLPPSWCTLPLQVWDHRLKLVKDVWERKSDKRRWAKGHLKRSKWVACVLLMDGAQEDGGEQEQNASAEMGSMGQEEGQTQDREDYCEMKKREELRSRRVAVR